MEIPQDVWQTEINGRLHDTTYEEITEFVTNGTLQPTDKIRRRNLNWIEAGKVPALNKIFQARPPAPKPAAPTTPTVLAPSAPPVTTTVHQTDSGNSAKSSAIKRCAIHSTRAYFKCDGCYRNYCKDCPKTDGEDNRFCPLCGGICHLLGSDPDDIHRTYTGAPQAPKTKFDPYDIEVDGLVSDAPDLSAIALNAAEQDEVGFALPLLIAFVVFAALGYIFAFKLTVPNNEAIRKSPEMQTLNRHFEVARGLAEKRAEEIEVAKPENASLVSAEDSIRAELEKNKLSQQLANANSDDQNATDFYSREKRRIADEVRSRTAKMNFLMFFVGGMTVTFLGLVGIRRWKK